MSVDRSGHTDANALNGYVIGLKYRILSPMKNDYFVIQDVESNNILAIQ